MISEPIKNGWLPHNLHATIGPVVTFCLASPYCSIQVPVELMKLLLTFRMNKIWQEMLGIISQTEDKYWLLRICWIWCGAYIPSVPSSAWNTWLLVWPEPQDCFPITWCSGPLVMKSGLATASFRWQEMDRNLLIFQGFFISLDCVLNNIAILVDTEKKNKK